jgi:hypothetical protein
MTNPYTFALKRLYEVQYTLNPTHFTRIFEGRHPLHLWTAFCVKHNGNLLAFFNNLDADNKALFLQYLTEKDKHDGNPETKN